MLLMCLKDHCKLLYILLSLYFLSRSGHRPYFSLLSFALLVTFPVNFFPECIFICNAKCVLQIFYCFFSWVCFCFSSSICLVSIRSICLCNVLSDSSIFIPSFSRIFLMDTYLWMFIGQVTRPVVQSQHPGHSWHMFGGLVWLRGSRTSVDDHPNVCPNDS